MSRLNRNTGNTVPTANARNARTPVRTPVRSTPIQTSSVPARTHGGAPGYLPAEARSELLDLGVVLFANGEKTFYESGDHRDARFTNLTEIVAVHDPEWTFNFLTYLRFQGYIRTASVMGAAHAVHARLQNKSGNGDGWNRKIVASVPGRLDEVKEFAAYWTKNFGPMPSCVKRGISDATARLANEYTYMKYGIQGNDAWTLPDVIDMVHAKPAKWFQTALYGYALADRHGNLMWRGDLPYTLKQGEPVYFSGLEMIMANKALRRDFADNPNVLLNPQALKDAGFTWEDALSLAGSRVDKAKLWESLIFSDVVPVNATIKNLRNMEQAGISREAMKVVCDKISNPEIIAKSRLLPYEIWAAVVNTNSVHWDSALDDALTLCTTNVPELPGRTLILVDASGSMVGTRLSNNSSLDRTDAAAIFGAALALKNAGRCDLYTFSNDVRKVNSRKGESLLNVIKAIKREAAYQGGGTDTAGAVRNTFNKHDRIVILTDQQSTSHHRPVVSMVPDSTYVYSFDLAGYRASDIPSGKARNHVLYGLTDGSFKLIHLLEQRQATGWPWEVAGQ